MNEILFIIIIILFLIILLYMEPIFSKQKLKNSNEYGSARFSTRKEINKNAEIASEMGE